jgi:hypothetical protein
MLNERDERVEHIDDNAINRDFLPFRNHCRVGLAYLKSFGIGLHK